MTAHPEPPCALSAQELRDYQQAQNDHSELMQQVTDREAQVENGLIDSYDDYSFIWDRHDTGGE